MIELPKRHIHLDFHTSSFIEGIGKSFDPEEFANTMANAHVENVNIFAKCHHGMSYFPTKIGEMHPHLNGRDLLGEMIEALHRKNIKCPLYTTVVWEERIADLYPQWRQMTEDGNFCQLSGASDMQTDQPGRWRFNSFAHPEYQDYFEAHLLELIENYEVDGFWIDILFMHEKADFNEAVIKKREKHHLLANTTTNNAKFESLMQQEFADRFTSLIQSKLPQASVFYNSTNRAFTDSRYGWSPRVSRETHNEIESLPSGFWGYYHFPRLARQSMMWDIPFLGMTGRFQKMWGDFGGVKPQAALEYETFRMQALGGTCSVGDQMYPNGKLDQGAYQLIGNVYAQIEAAEPFYENTLPCPQGAVLLAGNPGSNENLSGQSEEGAVLMMEELHIDVAVIDDSNPLDEFDFIILPDSSPITETLKTKLKSYYDQGGKIILSFEAGFDSSGKWALDFLPINIKGRDPLYPSYWRSTPEFLKSYANDCRVIYQQGTLVEGINTEILIERIPPYFKRSDLKFSSHFQTPPNTEAEPGIAALAGNNFIYFADPIFREYRQCGNIFLRDHLKAALDKLNIHSIIGDALDPHIHVYPRRKGNDLHLTLINYIPARKSQAIDVIERALSFHGQVISLPKPCEGNFYDEKEPLAFESNSEFSLPGDKKGRLLITFKNYF